MRLSVIIPVYNEKKTILEILKKISDVPVEKEIIIVDDKSTDGTTEILKGLIKSKLPAEVEHGNLKIVFKEKNEGKGSAIREGLKYVKGDYVVFQDADLEYNPLDYVRMLEPIVKGKTEVVYGSRFLSKGNRFLPLSFFANKFLTLLVNILFHSRLTDMETCYKLCPSDLLMSLDLRANGFEIEVEMTCKILKKRFEICEIPIRYISRDVAFGKKIGFKDGLKAIASIIKYRLVT